MKKKFHIRYLLGPIVGMALLLWLFWDGSLQDRIDNVYEAVPPQKIMSESQIKFEDVTKQAGVNFEHKYFFPHAKAGKNENLRVLGTMFPAVTVADVDGDGYMDIYFSAGRNRVPNLFYHNNGNGTFTEMGESLGISFVNEREPSSFSIFADFNKDGKMDLLVGKWGCHQLFYGQGRGKPFKDVSEKLNGYCSNPNGIGVADLNKDGLLDLVFGNFLPDVDLRHERPDRWAIGVRGDKTHGGKNHVLFQKPDGSFDNENKIEFKTAAFTHAVGLTDLNHDGYPDILFADDHASDELFINKKGKSFKDITPSYLPIAKHGYSSMNSEIYDFNRDGRPDIYITNVFKPPFQRANNVLWKRMPGLNSGFEEVAWDYGVARCGYSWGAKFADFDHDGEEDLFVVNGRVQSPSSHNPEDSSSFWYERFLTAEVPLFLRKMYTKTYVQGDEKNFYMSAFERNCIFQQKNGHFFDVGPASGVNDLYNGRGLALIDYDNDGKMDLVIVNVGGPAILYHNISQSQGEWIGFDLDGGRGWRIPFGARLILERINETGVVREVYPTNGMKAQSDPRINIGLRYGTKLGRVIVVWPDGHKEIFSHFSKNKYNHLIRGEGDSSGDRSPSQEH